MAAEERLWFKEAVESLFARGLRDEAPVLVPSLKNIGINLDAPLLPAYPATVWADAVKLAARQIHPDQPLDRGCYQVGRLFSDGYASTFMGRALFTFLKTLGPRRTLPRMGRNFRSVTNYLEVTVKELRPDCFAAQFNHVDDIPWFYKGVIDASGEYLGAPRAASDLIDRNGAAMTLYIDIRPTPTDPFPSPADRQAAGN